MNKKRIADYLQLAIRASLEAGLQVLEIYSKEFDVDFKEDKSPLTIADTASHKIIEKYLTTTGLPVLSEEGKEIPFAVRKNWNVFWMVDPLDGTKEFIKRNGEFTINIALIQDRKPVLGVIYIPVQHLLYFGCEYTGSIKVTNAGETNDYDTTEAWVRAGKKLPLKTNRSIYTVVGSKSHLTPETKDYIDRLEMKHGRIDVLSRGSSLKICMIAEGSADIYPRFAPTMEWDIAAGHAIVKFAGCAITDINTGNELEYNGETLVNPWFIAQRST
ncbi:MAG: 3'(2'),5'-bisphosphate nucleotidase CysQ [Bacteroidales bacterium]